MSLAQSAARLVKRFATPTVTLTRTINAAPDEATPWIPGAATTDVYALDAVVHGVGAQYVDGTTVVASDLLVVALPLARHTLHAGVAADGALVRIVPAMGDVLAIDGAAKAIKRIAPAPAAGDAALFRLFVAS